MIDVYAGALLAEQAGFEKDELGRDRKALVATLHAERHLADRGRLRGIDSGPSESMARFEELQQPLFVLVEDQLKLTWCPDDGLLELYDLAADPGELRDLAPARRDDAERLRRQLALWRDLRD